MGAAGKARGGERVGRKFERAHGGPALATQGSGDIGRSAERHEHPTFRLAPGRGQEHGVGKQGEAGGGFGVAADVTAAAAEFEVTVGRIEGHADAGVIAQAAEFDRVDGEFKARGAATNGGDRGGEAVGMGAGAWRQGGTGEGREGAIGGARGEQEVGQGAGERAAAFADGGGVLAIQRAGEAGADLAGDAALAEQGRHQQRQRQVDGDAGKADGMQRGDADEDDFGIGLGTVMADKFDAGLGDLAIRRGLAALHAQALAGIGQPQGARSVGEAGGGDAGDLRRHVGPHPHHPPRVRVHQPERLVGHGGTGAAEERILELEQRRFDALVAVRGKSVHQGCDGRGLGFGIGRQQVVQPGGKQGRVGRRIVGHCKLVSSWRRPIAPVARRGKRAPPFRARRHDSAGAARYNGCATRKRRPMDLDALRPFAGLTLPDAAIPELPNRYRGKVRENYDMPGGRRVLIATDRLSAFDRMICAIPFKGQVLTQTARYWFEATADICPNHVLSYPDPNVVIARKLDILPVEMVVRGYLAGTTGTSILTMYKKGQRGMYGVRLPDGLRDNEILPGPILTPTSKEFDGGHDAPLTPHEIVKSGLLPAHTWDEMSTHALALFARGQEMAAARGLILADTKYEFGLDGDDKVILADEIHTPDSSRFWRADTYRARFEAGLPPESFDKDVIRRWISARCDPYRDDLPAIPEELILETALAYIQAFEMITGKTFDLPADRTPVLARIRHNLLNG